MTTATRHTGSASARKMYGKYKAVILYPPAVGAIGKHRSEFIGTRYHLTQDGRDLRVSQGAPLYNTREEAIAVAQRLIEIRARTSESRCAAYEARHLTDDKDASPRG